MIIKTLRIGAFQVNNYLVINEISKEAVLIDAGGDYNQTVDLAREYGAKIVAVLNTHGHLDHIAGDYELQNKEGSKIYIHKDDVFLVNILKQQLGFYGMPEYEEPVIDKFVEDAQEIAVGGFNFKVIHTPGHSPGCVCYLIENALFSGDTLFYESVGRTDLPGGSYSELEKSVKQKLFALDDSITVYPGHGKPSTIGHEKKYNPFFKIESIT